MPKIIFTSRYLRNASSARFENYVRYIGTREGVEKIDESRRLLSANMNQQRLIRQLVRDIPASKEMLEYADFLLHPTIGNASEFISCALEQNLDLVAKRENYVDYIANRPRVEQIGEHGLFTDAGKPVVLKHVQEEVIKHKGPVWTHVVSLQREDAARLGYDSAKQWMALLRSKRAMLCKHMKIDSVNLCWYAAFHNEGHHPHVHLMVYSAKDNDGFLTGPSIEAMRSELTHDIFRQDFANLYEKQNQTRAELKTGTDRVLQELLDTLRCGTMVSPDIVEQMVLLSARLQNTGGKKVYGYLKCDVKNLVDQIVDELAKDSRVAALYQAWSKWQNEIFLTYQKDAPSLPPLSRQKQFKSIKNMVIAEAMKLGGHYFTFEDEDMPASESTANPDGPTEPIVTEDEETMKPDWTPRLPSFRARSGSGNDSMWNDRYKEARRCLFGDANSKPDFARTQDLFLKEAQSGNPFAMHDLGRMFAAGLGTEQDYEKAATWFSKAVEVGDKYAKYSLAGLYYRGQGMEQSYEQAKMYRDGIGTEQDIEQTVVWITKVAEGKNAAAQYALAKIYRDGEYVQRDIGKTVELFTLSAEQKNEYAAYQLGKLYLVGEDIPKDVDTAVKWFTCSAADGSQYAQYTLGKLYLCGHDVPRDKEKAVPLLQASAVQGNIYAQFLLNHIDSFRDPSAFLSVTRLLRRLENLFREDCYKVTGGAAYHIDRKRRRSLAEKRQAQGHKRDDREPVQQPNY